MTIRTKAVLVLFAVVFSTLAAKAQSGNISMRSENATVAEVMRAVEEQTDFRFSYNKRLFDVTRTVALPERVVPLKKALDVMTAGQNAEYVIRKNHIAVVLVASPERPPVRSAPLAPRRTCDVYVPNNRDSLVVAPTPRPVAPETLAEPAPVPTLSEPVPVKSQFSDYTPPALYGQMPGKLPRFALKTNLLYGLGTLTPNIAAEIALSPRWTFEAAYSSNPWNYKAKAAGEPHRKLLHGIARVEVRRWFCERFSGHFLGVHGLYSEYNVGGLDIPMLFEKDYRYAGNAWGGGIVYGYDLPTGRRWNIEFTVGVGVYRMKYDRYSCLTCSTDAVPLTKTWVGPSRLGVSLEFLIK
jgi:hypothetical protein